MKTFVTYEYLQSCLENIANLRKNLEDIRSDKHTAFQGDTNTWHDNFAYENATRQEKLAEDRLFKALRDIDDYVVFSDNIQNNPNVVGIYCWVKIIEENTDTDVIDQKTVGIVPFGGQDIKNKIYSYNAPLIFPLIGAKIGEERTIKIPKGTFKIKILSIQKM